MNTKIPLLAFAMLALAACNSPKQTPPAPPTPPPPAAAQVSPTAAPEKTWSCVKGSDTREYEVVKKADGCDLDYTKAGKLKVEMTAAHGEHQCEVRQARDLANLKREGFKCS